MAKKTRTRQPSALEAQDPTRAKQMQKELIERQSRSEREAHARPAFGEKASEHEAVQEVAPRYLEHNAFNPPPDQSIHEKTMNELHPEVTTPQGTQEDSIGNAHEERDVNFRALGGWMIGLYVFLFAHFLVLWFVFNWFGRREERKDVVASPLIAAMREAREGQPPPAPPGPPLLPQAEIPIQVFNRQQDQFLNTPGQVEQTGQTRIPITQAMNEIAQATEKNDLKDPRRLPIDNAKVAAGQGTTGQQEPFVDLKNEALFIPPSYLGIGKNDPDGAFRIGESEGVDDPTGRALEHGGIDQTHNQPPSNAPATPEHGQGAASH